MIEAIVTLTIPARRGYLPHTQPEPAHTKVFRLEFESERYAMEWLENPGGSILSLERLTAE